MTVAADIDLKAILADARVTLQRPTGSRLLPEEQDDIVETTLALLNILNEKGAYEIVRNRARSMLSDIKSLKRS